MKPQHPERDWRRIHHSPMFWIGIVMCLAAITIYVLSDDLSWRPGARCRIRRRHALTRRFAGCELAIVLDGCGVDILQVE